MSSPDDGNLEYGVDPVTSAFYALVAAVDPIQTANNQVNQYNNCPFQLCFYNQDGNECWELITCGTAPEHFSAVHGIRRMARGVEITCGWQGCECLIRRHNFIRHIREVHLGHGRRVNHQN
ncbi:hypothetical protein EDC04DRAFT_3092077 [Pisolithus marmoratus]|nr:hypothetical protein EDC04DRAFT_3092077 [Pisolithus marmoratus]